LHASRRTAEDIPISQVIAETEAVMPSETLRLVDQAERIRMDALRLCQETDETLRQSENLRAESEYLRAEVRREVVGFVMRARRAAHISRGAGPEDAPRSHWFENTAFSCREFEQLVISDAFVIISGESRV
jgi:hypothetical protein